MFSLPQWHRLTQTNFPPRPRKTVRHSDITDEIWQHGAQQTRSRWAPPSAQLLPAPHYQVASSDAAAPRCFFPQSACTTKSHFGNSYTLWQPPPSFSATVTHLGTSVFDDSYTLWQPPPPSSTAVRHFRNLHLCFGQSYTLSQLPASDAVCDDSCTPNLHLASLLSQFPQRVHGARAKLAFRLTLSA